MEIWLSSLKFHSSDWEPFYEQKLYLLLPVLPRTFYVLTESLTAVHLFRILVPLKLLGEHHLVLAICYNSCYWFVLHKNVRMTALRQTKGLSASVSFLANTRCLGKIIRRKGVVIVPLNSLLAFKHLWFGDCWSSSCLLILKLLMNFSSAKLVIVEEKAGLTFHICKTPWKEYHTVTVYCAQKDRFFCFVSCFYFLQGNLFSFQHLQWVYRHLWGSQTSVLPILDYNFSKLKHCSFLVVLCMLFFPYTCTILLTVYLWTLCWGGFVLCKQCPSYLQVLYLYKCTFYFHF